MNPLPIPLLLPIKDRIFILRPHLLLPRHLHFPSFHLLQSIPLFTEGVIDHGDDGVDGAETFALAGFLRGGQAEGDLPVVGTRVNEFSSGRCGLWKIIRMHDGVSYQRRPPDRGEVPLKGPNIWCSIAGGLEDSIN